MPRTVRSSALPATSVAENGDAPPARRTVPGSTSYIAIASNRVADDPQSRASSTLTSGTRPTLSSTVLKRTSRSGAGKGKGRRNTPSITLKIAVVAAMPIAMASITDSVITGARRHMRHP